MSFNTANGVTHADQNLKVDVDEFASKAKSYILDHTPNVPSVGTRCMKQGFSLIWPAEENPYFVLPDDRVVQLE
eukprot:8736474-Lingulodinium_polyedra.AAC.1